MYQYQQSPEQSTETISQQVSSGGQSNSSQQQSMNNPMSFPPNTLLQKGSRGDLVKRLQQILKGLGFPIFVDGTYGPQTEKVVRDYQRLNRLDIDGVAGMDTLNKLAPSTNVASSAQNGSTSQSTSPTNAPASTNSASTEHRVFPGESLWVIAAQYYGDGRRWREIANANGMSDTSVLRVGQVLQIPGVTSASNGSSTTAAPEKAQPSTEPEVPATPSRSTAEHRVFPGESLWVIAAQYYGDGRRWREIANANGMSDASVLRVGQVLQIPNTTTANDVSTTPRVTVPEVESNESTNSGSNSGNSETVQAPPASQGGIGAPDPIPLAGLNGLRRAMAEIYNEKGLYLKRKAEQLGISVAAAAAVLHVESGGRGFAGDGRMIIRFENHIFWDQWGKHNPEKFRDHFTFSSGQQWKGHKFRPSVSAPFESFHGNQGKEWEVLEFARGLSDTGALQSISMGAAQIMGFNHRGIGYENVQAMFEAMCNGLPAQLDGMFSFIENNSRCMRGLRNNDFVLFASGYNGSGQAEAYGGLISSANSAFQAVTAGRSQI